MLGGVTTLLYGMIGMMGVRIWVDNHVNFDKSLNVMTAAIVMIIGIADFTFAIQGVQFNGIAIGHHRRARCLPRPQGHRQGPPAPSRKDDPDIK